MLELSSKAVPLKLQEVTGLCDLADTYLVAVIFEFYIAGFYLLEVAHASLLLALTNGKGTVTEVDQHLRSLQIVACQRPSEVSFRRVS